MENKQEQDNKKKTSDIDEFFDNKTKRYYTNESLLRGLIHHTFFSNTYDGAGGSDNYGAVGATIGSGKRAEVIRALGFSDHPTKEECWSKMKTIELQAYPGRKITMHSALEAEVQAIFNGLKSAGVNLNQYIGGFVYRPINNPSHPGSTTLSMHSFGCAIDINYDLNPFVKNGKPKESGDDTPRGIVRTMNSPIVKAFASNGWGWGGRYGDYMHFSKANGG